jgi:hypothetical protein
MHYAATEAYTCAIRREGLAMLLPEGRDLPAGASPL